MEPVAPEKLLESSLKAICLKDWGSAQAYLSKNLESSFKPSYRRLTLFLLSVVAEATGHIAVSQELVTLAQATPVDSEAAQIFSLNAPGNSIRRQLDEAWQEFNGLTKSNSFQSFQTIDWAYVLDNITEGRTREIESKYSAAIESEHPYRHILWNLLALGYLSSGDLRTHQEMRDSKPPPVNSKAPESLEALLKKAGLTQALENLTAGQWLTLDELVVVEPPNPYPPKENDAALLSSSDTKSAKKYQDQVEEYSWDSGIEVGPKLQSPSMLDISDFWTQYKLAIGAMKSGDFTLAKGILHRLLATSAELGQTPYLLALILFTGNSILESDYVSAQDSLQECEQALAVLEPDKEVLHTAAQCFSSFGCTIISQRMSQELIKTIDPWHDFPNDFHRSLIDNTNPY